MIKSQLFKDTRTGEVVSQVPISEISFFEPVVNNHNDTAKEVAEIAKTLWECAGEGNFEAFEEAIGDGDPFDYI